MLIGNPPYVRRWWQRDVDALQVIAEQMRGCGAIFASDRSGLLFCHSRGALFQAGGRLALIVSDSWLDMRYGTAFKDYLLRAFRVRGMIGFQSQVFPDVLVRPVVILAEKHAEPRPPGRSRVAFVSLNGRIPKALPLDPCHLLESRHEQASGTILRMHELLPEQHWTPFLYTPPAYVELMKHAAMTLCRHWPGVRIGFQSFAKMFYIVPRDTQQRWELERRWLRPFMMSPKDVVTARPQCGDRHATLHSGV